MRLLVKLYNKGKVKILRSSNKNRFSQKLRLALDPKNGFKSYFLKVDYDKKSSNSGRYIDKHELMKAYNAFTDPTLVSEWG